LETIRREVERLGSPVLAVPTDVTNPGQVCSFVEQAWSRFGSVDIAVANAGQYYRRPAVQLTVPEIRRIMEVNFYGSLHLIYAVLPKMLERRSGHIVAVSSVDGKKGLPPDTAYVSSKFALNGFMDVLRQELYDTGVHASTILPARVDTPMVQDLRLPFVSPRIPPERVARAILRAVRAKRAEVVVPYVGPMALILASTLSPRLGDFLVRRFKLEGEEVPEDMSHNSTV
jgi:NAD(P)-dependent dehydrogenase (short-subunit alcohol dehydrogenase family)